MTLLRYFITGMLLTFASTTFSQKLYKQSSGTTEKLNCVAFATDSIGWIAGDRGTLLTTTDSGRDWKLKALSTSANLYAAYQYDAMNGVVAGDSGTVFSMVNGQWYHPGLPDKKAVSQAVYAVVYSTADTVLAVGQLGLIYKSVDGGRSWSRQNSGTSADLHGVEFFDELNYYVTGKGGTLLYTTDGGSNWIPQDLGITKDLYSITFPNDTGWIAGDNTLLYSTDDGANWQNISTSDSLRSLLGIDGRNASAVGKHGALHYTKTGKNWSDIPSGTVVNLNSIDVPNDMYMVGDGGLILTSLYTPASGVADKNARDAAVSVYPNPAATSVILNLNGREVDRVLIRSDVGGTVIDQTVNSSVIDIHDLAAGTYFCDVWIKHGGLEHCRFTVVH